MYCMGVGHSCHFKTADRNFFLSKDAENVFSKHTNLLTEIRTVLPVQ